MEVKKTVAGKEYVFDKASLYLRDLYSEMSELAIKISMVAQDYREDIQDLSDEAEITESKKDRIELRDRLREMSAGFDEQKDRLKARVSETREEILRALCELHGYEFDYDVWYMNIDIDDINDIVTTVFK